MSPEIASPFPTAVELAQQVRNGEISSRQLMENHLKDIERLNPEVNAIVNLDIEGALQRAEAADDAQAKGRLLGPLHGLPIAHKDLALTAGMRTTFGSPLFAEFIPRQNSLIVERLREAGTILLGKTNVPEFGAGSQTYNELFGATRNPYDLTKTCGGSSGGAAVALACGLVPVADGSDFGGSLRNPASFCNVVGFRPSPGRVPVWPSDHGWSSLSVEGPMARTVGDVALMLSVIAGPDARSPISLSDPGSVFTGSLERNFHETKIAWSPDLGGLPVDTRITQVIESQLPIFESLGCRVDVACPDFGNAETVFKTLRASFFAQSLGEARKKLGNRLKETIRWNVDQGLSLSAVEVGRAEKERTRLYHRVRSFMQEHEFLIFPVSQSLPFDINQPWVKEIEGVEMPTYLDWMMSCCYVTLTGHPAISVPCGFSDEGLPVGLQIVGRHHNDRGVLELAWAFEQATQTWKQQPAIVNDLKTNRYAASRRDNNEI